MCHRCGGTEREEIDDSHARCAECGEELSFSRLVLMSDDDTARTPQEQAQLDRLVAEMRRRPDERFEARPFPVYGLDDRWTGLRFIGGSGSSDGETTLLGLAHGDPVDPDAPHVRVDTSRPQRIGRTTRREPRLDRMFLAKNLAGHLWRETGVLRDDVRAAAFALDEGSPFSVDPVGPWDRVTLPVDGVAVVFRVLVEGDHWVAVGEVDGRFVAITARHWPTIETVLVAIEDFAPYYEGSAALPGIMRRPRDDD
jgi:hypothetical protein